MPDLFYLPLALGAFLGLVSAAHYVPKWIDSLRTTRVSADDDDVTLSDD